jgi:hypothetical protein
MGVCSSESLVSICFLIILRGLWQRLPAVGASRPSQPAWTKRGTATKTIIITTDNVTPTFWLTYSYCTDVRATYDGMLPACRATLAVILCLFGRLGYPRPLFHFIHSHRHHSPCSLIVTP